MKSDIVEYVNSDEIDIFDPIADYLEHLPKWNGENHVARLFNRLPGVDSELTGYLATWLRSAVAHWLQMDTIHGNECVPTLIGAQGCGKTTFFVRLLPPHLRAYYLDHLNLSNKFDKEMALTNNLLVNIDELDAIPPSQHASLKQGERTPHLWCLPGRPTSLCLVCSYDKQSSSANRCHWFTPIHLHDDS